jgi:hypothetical protein
MRIPFLDNIVTGFMRGILKTYDFLTDIVFYIFVVTMLGLAGFTVLYFIVNLFR